jgi:hypothetical protein
MRLPREYEEGCLEGVLGEVVIAEELSADAQHHRTVPCHERGEGGLGSVIAAAVEPLEELAVGEPRERPAIEERTELPCQ